MNNGLEKELARRQYRAFIGDANAASGYSILSFDYVEVRVDRSAIGIPISGADLNVSLFSDAFLLL